jgi:prolyl-tRNA editing enzyme YbaK/EbsC (Cys-tRNA(Pro) deacylase)
MSNDLFDSIRTMLDAHNVAYRTVHHEPTRTSEESAQARGESVRVGGKALLLKVADDFHLFVLSAACKLDSAAIRKHFGVKGVRFATPEELLERTGLVPGSVPPFGRPILPFDLYVDESIARNERIAFNAGSLTDSVIMSVADYMRIASPTMLTFGIEPEDGD